MSIFPGIWKSLKKMSQSKSCVALDIFCCFVVTKNILLLCHLFFMAFAILLAIPLLFNHVIQEDIASGLGLFQDICATISIDPDCKEKFYKFSPPPEFKIFISLFFVLIIFIIDVFIRRYGNAAAVKKDNDILNAHFSEIKNCFGFDSVSIGARTSLKKNNLYLSYGDISRLLNADRSVYFRIAHEKAHAVFKDYGLSLLAIPLWRVLFILSFAGMILLSKSIASNLTAWLIVKNFFESEESINSFHGNLSSVLFYGMLVGWLWLILQTTKATSWVKEHQADLYAATMLNQKFNIDYHASWFRFMIAHEATHPPADTRVQFLSKKKTDKNLIIVGTLSTALTAFLAEASMINISQSVPRDSSIFQEMNLVVIVLFAACIAMHRPLSKLTWWGAFPIAIALLLLSGFYIPDFQDNLPSKDRIGYYLSSNCFGVLMGGYLIVFVISIPLGEVISNFSYRFRNAR